MELSATGAGDRSAQLLLALRDGAARAGECIHDACSRVCRVPREAYAILDSSSKDTQRRASRSGMDNEAAYTGIMVSAVLGPAVFGVTFCTLGLAIGEIASVLHGDGIGLTATAMLVDGCISAAMVCYAPSELEAW
jgi:hypothetical protein